jgi:hypothetical protein
VAANSIDAAMRNEASAAVSDNRAAPEDQARHRKRELNLAARR